MKRLADFIAHLVVQRPKYLIAATVVILVLCTWRLATQQTFDSEVLNLLPSGSQGVQALKVFNSDFRQGRELIIALSGAPDTISDREDDFIAKLRAEPWVERVFAGPPTESPEEIAALQRLIPQMLLNADDATFPGIIAALQPGAIAEHLHQLREKINSGSPLDEGKADLDPLGLVGKAMLPLVKSNGMEQGGSLTSPDGTLRLYPVVTRQASLNQADCRAVMAQVEAFRTRTLAEWSGEKPDILVTGRTAYVSQIAGSMERDVGVTSFLSFFVVTGLFFVGFRRLVPPLGTSLILAIACYVSFAIGLLIFDNLNMIAIAFCSILAGLGDDFSLLLYNRYLLARGHHEAHQPAIATAIREVGRGIIYVSLTTGAGFLVLCFSGSSGFAQLGVLIAIGILCCAVFIILLLFLCIGPNHTQSDRPDPLHHLFDGLTRFLLKQRVPLGLFAGVLALATLAFALLPFSPLQFDTNPRSLEPKQIPAAKTLQLINQKVPAAAEPVIVLLDSPNPESAHQSWQKLETHFQQLTEKGLLASYSSPAALMLSPARLLAHREALRQSVDFAAARTAFLDALATEEFKPESFTPTLVLLDDLKAALDSKADHLELQGALPESSGWWFLLDRYLSLRPNLAAAYLRPAETVRTYPQQLAFETRLRESGVPIAITGWSYTMVGLVPWAQRELFTFSAAVGALIVLSMGLAYRKWRPFLVHTASLCFALTALITLLKLTHTPINMLNALAFPLVLGVGVDYGMHLLLALSEEGDPRENLRTVLKPLIISGLTTIAGFGSLMLALNPALKGLGTVCALGVTSCLATSVFFAVPILSLLGMEKSKATH